MLLGLAIVGSMIFPRQSEKAVTENTPKTEQEMIVSITSDANPQERPVIVGSDASGYVFRDPSDPAYSTSTFDLHSSKGSYLAISNAIQNGVLPKPASVSIDQMVNYFEYDFPAPKDEESMSVSVEAIPCPWSPESQLVQVGLIGRETAENETGKVEVASGVDVQVQFDPAKVKSYRLLG